MTPLMTSPNPLILQPLIPQHLFLYYDGTYPSTMTFYLPIGTYPFTIPLHYAVTNPTTMTVLTPLLLCHLSYYYDGTYPTTIMALTPLLLWH